MIGFTTFSDGARLRCIFDESGWWSTGSVRALGTTTDGEGLVIDEFDFDILLLDTWKFTVEFIDFTGFLDIEFGGEGLHDIAAAVVRVVVIAATAVLIKVVKKTEERVEGRSVVCDVVSWEERHFACGCLWFENSFDSCCDWKS